MATILYIVQSVNTANWTFAAYALMSYKNILRPYDGRREPQIRIQGRGVPVWLDGCMTLWRTYV